MLNLLGVKLSQYHSGYRSFSRDVLARLRPNGLVLGDPFQQTLEVSPRVEDSDSSLTDHVATILSLAFKIQKNRLGGRHNRRTNRNLQARKSPELMMHALQNNSAASCAIIAQPESPS